MRNTRLRNCAGGHYKNTPVVIHPALATAGDGSVATNLRRMGQDLVVTGIATPCGNIPSGHRLLLVDDVHYITQCGDVICCDGVGVFTLSEETVVGTHKVGDLVVIVTSGRLIYMSQTGESCEVINVDDAIPSILLTETDVTSEQHAIAGFQFSESYSQWPTILSTADTSSLTSQYSRAWKNAVTSVRSRGAFYTPMMACYGVRLWDDSYLWVSEAVVMGLSTMANADAVSAQVATQSGRYVGAGETVMTMESYRLGIKVMTGVPFQWQRMVKAIDIFVKDMPAIAHTSSLSYRCNTTQGGMRVATLQYGWQLRTQAQVLASLQAQGWNLVASTTDHESLAEGRFIAPTVNYVSSSAMSELMTLDAAGHVSVEQMRAVGKGYKGMNPVASVSHNGRLYVASREGVVMASAPGNAMVPQQVHQVTGTHIMAVAGVSRPLFSAGFGRYALYLFTDQGIYAVAQSAKGVLGEARLVDRTVIATGSHPVEGDKDIYLVSHRGRLCRVSGSVVTQLLPVKNVPLSMVWNDVYKELLVVQSDGDSLAITPDGYWSHRTLAASDLYGDHTHVIAVTSEGELLDLAHEKAAEQPVEYMSHLVTMHPCIHSSPQGVSWHVCSEKAELTLELHGERGVNGSHRFLVSRLRVQGALSAPLCVPVLSPPCGSVRLLVKGSAVTGSVLSTFSITIP